MATICNTDVSEGTYSGACAAAILKSIGVSATVAEKFATASAVAFTAHGPTIVFVHAGDAWPEGMDHTQEHRTRNGTMFLNRGWRKPAAVLADWPACVERPAAAPVHPPEPAPQPHSGDAPECAAASLGVSAVSNEAASPVKTAVTVDQERLLADMTEAMSEVLGRHGVPNEIMAAMLAAIIPGGYVNDAEASADPAPGVAEQAPIENVTVESHQTDDGGIEELVEEEAPPTLPVKTLVPGWVPADSLEDPGLFEPASPEAKKEARRLQQYLKVTRDASVRREIIETIARLEGKAK